MKAILLTVLLFSSIFANAANSIQCSEERLQEWKSISSKSELTGEDRATMREMLSKYQTLTDLDVQLSQEFKKADAVANQNLKPHSIDVIAQKGLVSGLLSANVVVLTERKTVWPCVQEITRITSAK